MLIHYEEDVSQKENAVSHFFSPGRRRTLQITTKSKQMCQCVDNKSVTGGGGGEKNVLVFLLLNPHPFLWLGILIKNKQAKKDRRKTCDCALISTPAVVGAVEPCLSGGVLHTTHHQGQASKGYVDKEVNEKPHRC